MSAAAKRSNQSIRKPLLIITVAFIVFSAAILTIAYKAEVRYFLMGAFEEPVDLRKDYSIHGIDVSRYQGNINWNGVGQVQKGYNIVTKEASEKWLTHKAVRLATPEELASYYGKA